MLDVRHEVLQRLHGEEGDDPLYLVESPLLPPVPVVVELVVAAHPPVCPPPGEELAGTHQVESSSDQDCSYETTAQERQPCNISALYCAGTLPL